MLFDKEIEQALRIHNRIRAIATSQELVVGFPSPSLVPEAYEELRRFGFRKPFLKSAREWTRRAIVFEPRVYEFLWHRVELEFIIGDSLKFFSGLGSPRRANPILFELEAKLPTVYWVIVLGGNFEKFSDLIPYDSSKLS